MSRLPISRAPTFAQLCVIAREQILAAPSIDDGEWKERIKDRLISLRFDYPDPPDLMTRAMTAVERALEKQWGPRPSSTPAPRPPIELPQQDPPWRRTRRGDPTWTSIQELLQQLVKNPRSTNLQLALVRCAR